MPRMPPTSRYTVTLSRPSWTPNAPRAVALVVALGAALVVAFIVALVVALVVVVAVTLVGAGRAPPA